MDCEAEDSSGLGHAVIGVAREHAAAQRPRIDGKAVLGLGDIAAKIVELGRQRGQPVGLVPPQVCDSPQPAGCLGECGQCGDHGSQLAHIVEVDVEAVNDTGAMDCQGVLVESHVCTHPSQQVPQSVPGLGGAPWPAFNPDGATSDESRGQEWRGVGQVGLDSQVQTSQRSGLHVPGVGLDVVDLGSGRAEQRDRHVDVWE